MTRHEFLWQLRTYLSGRMPPARMEDTIAYYEEYFAESGEADEHAVLAELGDPREVAARILGSTPAAHTSKQAQYIDYGHQQYRRRRRGLRLAAVVAGVFLMLGVIASLFYSVRMPINAVNTTIYTRVEAVTQPPRPAAQPALDPFHSLTMNVDAAEVEMIQGSHYSIEIQDERAEGQLQYEVVADGLRVWDEGRSGWRDAAQSPRVVITVPYDTGLSDVSLSIARGDLTLSGLKCNVLSLDSSMGSIELFDVNADQLTISLAAGELRLSDTTAQNAVVTGALGAAHLFSGQFDALSLDWQGGTVELLDCRVGTAKLHNTLGVIEAYGLHSNGLEVSGQGGSILLQGELLGLTSIEHTLGEVEVAIDLPRHEVLCDLQTTLGTVFIDGAETRGHTTGTNDAPNQLIISNQGGNINVSFSQ